MDSIQVRAYPAGPNLYWIECTACGGPIFLIDGPHTDTACIAHLNEHGCQLNESSVTEPT